MAVTKGPLMSFDASGSVAGSITFSKWKGRNYVRRLVIPANPKSGLQVGVRSVFKFLTQNYAALSDARKASWQAIADLTSVTALNAQVAFDQAQARRNLGIVIAPGESAGTTPSAPTGITITDQPGAHVVAWSAGATPPEYCWMVWTELGAGPVVVPDISKLVAVVPAATLSITNLVPDSSVTQAYQIAGLNFDGEIGANAGDST